MPESFSLTKTKVKLIPGEALVHASASTKFINDSNRKLGCTDVKKLNKIIMHLLN